MAVSYGDIRDWEPADAGKLADAMQALLGRLREIEHGLDEGKAWTDWRDSAGAEGAEGRITGIADYVTDRAAEAERVRDIAADVERSLEPVKSEVESAERTASSWGFRITDSGTIEDTGGWSGDDALREQARRDLEQAVDEIVRAGRAIEATAASGLGAVNANQISDDGALTVASAADAARRRHGIGDIPGKDASATEVNVWWNSLEDSQREEMMTSQRDRFRNRAGIPSADRDTMNRAQLKEDLERLRREKEELENSPSQNSHYYNGIGGGRDPKLTKGAELDRKIGELEKLQRVLEGKDTYLLEYDSSKKRLEAVVAHGNPDEASHVSITTPGFTSSVNNSVEGMSGEARDLRDKAARMGGLSKDEVSTISYIGYQAPHGADVLSTKKAKEGGRELADFTEGIAATNHHADLNLNLFGHSYGSTTTGIAAQFLNDDGVTPVDNLVVYGSPGFPVVDESGADVHETRGHAQVYSSPATPDLERDMGLSPDNAYFMKYNRDAISMTGALGATPRDWDMTRLDVATQQSTMPGAGTDGIPSKVYDVDDYNEHHDSDVSAHSSFPHSGTTSQENLAAVLGGRPDLVHHQR